MHCRSSERAFRYFSAAARWPEISQNRPHLWEKLCLCHGSVCVYVICCSSWGFIFPRWWFSKQGSYILTVRLGAPRKSFHCGQGNVIWWLRKRKTARSSKVITLILLFIFVWKPKQKHFTSGVCCFQSDWCRESLWFMQQAPIYYIWLQAASESECSTVWVCLFPSPSVFRHFGSMKSKHPGGRAVVLPCWGLTTHRSVERNSLMDERRLQDTLWYGSSKAA